MGILPGSCQKYLTETKVYLLSNVRVANKWIHSWLCCGICIGGNLLLGACPSTAQAAPDGTLSTRVSTAGSSVEITGGIQRGSNLFHSFEAFSIRTGEVANFRLPGNTSVENIISRVTGSSISNIDGTLQVGGATNLFLINPNGIIFGPNAILDIGGSFLGTTASDLTFADGTVFSAASSQATPLLTVNSPIGLQFGEAPGGITNQSNAMPITNISPLGLAPSGDPVGLQVRPGNALVLVGREVMFEGGHLTALGGRVELGSVDRNSFVGLTEVNQGWALDYSLVESFQDIRLGPLDPSVVPALFGDLASIDASGAGGTIRLRGRHIVLSNTQISNATTDFGNGGNIEVLATDSVEIDGVPSSLFSQVGIDEQEVINAPVTGNGGDILIDTQKLFIRNGGFISSGTLSQGKAGDIVINASELIEISGIGSPVPIPSNLSAATDGSGAGGVLSINTPQLTIRDGAQVVVTSSGSGAAGTLNITSDTLTLDQGLLNAQTEVGRGGNINLQVSGLLLLSNNSQITAEAGGTGDGGNIAIDAGLVFASPSQDSNIVANAFEGMGGNITINTQGLFGFAERQAIAGNGTNDIDASSEFGLAGGIEIDTLVSDPDSALVNLPEGVSDPSQKIAIGCAAKQGNSFVLAGRGGVPSSPQDLVSNPQLWNDVRDLSAFRTTQQRGYPSQEYATRPVTPAPLLEATGWHRDAQGRMRLVNHQPNLVSADLGDAAQTC
ncbi:hypothetical protein C1752_04083 [Acaryochloris thomasi RCC1774]|uniref:Filamentous haemagglutinin FhaB/tRNA nuclease CdiA-like TPS domain-containing protein n=1 Tax=Acaryochloris thomasi RCC1774 TaxID=1764569 RepID=A0A2W1JDX2_9CYAN|nr:filamentous hemagglutinin N-terminal domain-containing protein [Acaryochloris thomasi]PZD72013.1 hypothetical protein C1752_04083 [Acaryochloris thomasi RCC1774]